MKKNLKDLLNRLNNLLEDVTSYDEGTQVAVNQQLTEFKNSDLKNYSSQYKNLFAVLNSLNVPYVNTADRNDQQQESFEINAKSQI